MRLKWRKGLGEAKTSERMRLLEAEDLALRRAVEDAILTRSAPDSVLVPHCPDLGVRTVKRRWARGGGKLWLEFRVLLTDGEWYVYRWKITRL